MTSRYQEIHAGVTRIDVEYVRPGFAAAWLVREQDQAVFVETGPLPAVPILLEALTRQGLSPEAVQAILVTHVHLDHAGGAGELLRHLPNARLVVHPRGVEHLTDPSRLIEGAKVVYGTERFLATLGGATPVDPARITTAKDGELFFLQDRPLILLDTPGHSLNHLCIFDEKSRGLFTGDAFGLSYREFDGGIRPLIIPATTPTQFDITQYRATLQRLAALQPEWLLMTHFGPLPFQPELTDDLDRQLQHYQQLAEKTNEKNLFHALTTLTSAHLNTLQIPNDSLNLLEMDLNLNAQGLAIWQNRQQRKATSSCN
ncbi:MAG: MBL fold metallo-hydrolase [Magnetococcales bacterium]|nr:MBL fold metallo-hydrolase [Magnetococcales bacterium]